MLYSHLPAVANRIRRHHVQFAHRSVKDALTVLGELNLMIQTTPCVGATFPALMILPDTCEVIKTYITVNKTSCGWEVTESTTEPGM